MTAYDYDNLPDEMNIYALPAEIFGSAQAAFSEALESGLAVAHEAKVAYAYDRKGYLNVDEFGGERNASYGSNTDDVIIQLTLRVPHPTTVRQGQLDALIALEGDIKEHKVAAERARLEAEIAQAERDAEQAEATARAKREKLEALRRK